VTQDLPGLCLRGTHAGRRICRLGACPIPTSPKTLLRIQDASRSAPLEQDMERIIAVLRPGITIPQDLMLMNEICSRTLDSSLDQLQPLVLGQDFYPVFFCVRKFGPRTRPSNDIVRFLRY
jgi:hypothetical protein